MSLSSTKNATDIISSSGLPPMPPVPSSGLTQPFFTQGQKWPINPQEVTRDITDIKEIVAFDPQYAQLYFLSNADNLTMFKFYYLNPYQAPEEYKVQPGGSGPWIVYYIRESFVQFKEKNPLASSSNDPAALSGNQLTNLMAQYKSMRFKADISIPSIVFMKPQKLQYPIEDLFSFTRVGASWSLQINLSSNPTYNVRRKIYWELVETFIVYESRKRNFRVMRGTSVTLGSSLTNSSSIEASLGVEIGPVSSSITSKFSTESQQSSSYTYSEETEETIEDTYSKINNNPTTYYFWRLCHEFKAYKGKTNELLFTLLYPFFPLLDQTFQKVGVSRSQEEPEEVRQGKSPTDSRSIERSQVNDDTILELKSQLKAFLIPFSELDGKDLDEKLSKVNLEELKAKITSVDIPNWEEIKAAIDSADIPPT